VAEGSPFSDDSGILNQDELLRRVFPGWIVPDEKAASGYRLSGQAFEDDRRSKTPCSVSVRRCAPPLVDLAARFSNRSIASLGVGFARAHQQGVCFWPDPSEPGHAYLFGPKPKSVKDALAREARYLAGPRVWGETVQPVRIEDLETRSRGSRAGIRAASWIALGIAVIALLWILLR
jgi:hypothetical protein